MGFFLGAVLSTSVIVGSFVLGLALAFYWDKYVCPWMKSFLIWIKRIFRK